MKYAILLYLFISINSFSSISQDTESTKIKNDSLKIALIDSLNYESIEQLYISPIDGLNNAKKANKLAIGIDYKRGLAISLNYMGRHYYTIGEYELAQSTQLEALKIHQEIDLKKGIIISLETLGTIHSAINQYDQALEYYQRSIEQSKAIDFQRGIATSLGNIAILYKEQKQYNKALKYYERSLIIYKKENAKYNIARTLHNIGNLYYELKEYNNELLIQKQSLKLFTEINNEFGIIMTTTAIGRMYTATKDYKQSEIYLLKALEKTKSINKYSKKAHLYFCLYQLYEARKDYRKALKYHILQKEIQDKALSEKSLKQISYAKARYESELKNKDYEILKTKQKLHDRRIKTQRYSIYIIIGFSLLLLILCIIIYSKYRFRTKANKLLREQRKKLAKAVKIQNKLNKEKDGFMSILSHDLKNPFNVILGLLDSLKTDYDELNDEERTDYISNISNAANNAFKLLEDILTWSRAQSKGIKTNPKRLNIFELFTSSSEILQSVAQNKNISININVQKDKFITIDKFTISTVINNLINNAIKFTASGGMITLSAQEHKHFIDLKIQDTGIGMSKEDIDQLFQLGKNISKDGTNSEKGTGIGLLICDEFVKLNNGEIIVESVEGEGTCFSIRIHNQ